MGRDQHNAGLHYIRFQQFDPEIMDDRSMDITGAPSATHFRTKNDPWFYRNTMEEANMNPKEEELSEEEKQYKKDIHRWYDFLEESKKQKETILTNAYRIGCAGNIDPLDALISCVEFEKKMEEKKKERTKDLWGDKGYEFSEDRFDVSFQMLSLLADKLECSVDSLIRNDERMNERFLQDILDDIDDGDWDTYCRYWGCPGNSVMYYDLSLKDLIFECKYIDDMKPEIVIEKSMTSGEILGYELSSGGVRDRISDICGYANKEFFSSFSVLHREKEGFLQRYADELLGRHPEWFTGEKEEEAIRRYDEMFEKFKRE